ncbi:conserved hypothetical protein [Rhodospirillaceae bacterium LM-1]|nr:conserved hypothetical protein [Rhodospirillaceae bacterium LM-1]
MTDRDRIIKEIASKVFGLETLETRHQDSLDFHEVAVWSVRQALEAAYEAGLQTGKEAKR